MINRLRLWLERNKNCKHCCLWCEYAEKCKKDLL